MKVHGRFKDIERVSPTVPFGYMKSENDPKKWIVDAPAAEVVKHIFALCLSGRGPLQIAKQLEDEQVLIIDSIGVSYIRRKKSIA